MLLMLTADLYAANDPRRYCPNEYSLLHKNIKAGEEIFCEYSNTIDTTTFVRQVFRDFTQFMDITQEEKRANFLETMETDYTAMLASMKHDPNKVYRKP